MSLYFFKCRNVDTNPLFLLVSSLSFSSQMCLYAFSFLFLPLYLYLSPPLPLIGSPRTSSCYSRVREQSLWSCSFKSSLFQRTIAVGEIEQESEPMLSDSKAAPLRHDTPRQHHWRGEGCGMKEGGGRDRSNTYHTWKSPHPKQEKSRTRAES